MIAIPKATIVIPAYNGAQYLAAAVDSALAQDFGPFEVLVLDNASTDETPQIMARYADARLQYRRNRENLGLAGNVALGWELARGDYVMFSGADDLLLPGFLAQACAFLDARPGVSLVHGPAAWIDADGRRFGGTGQAWDRVTPGRLAMAGAFAQGFCFTTMLMRTAAIRATGAAGGHWQEVIDLWLFLRMCLAGDIGYLPDLLVEYRVHAGAMSMPMYRDNLMFRRQMMAAREAFAWPQAAAIGAAGHRREAERAAARIAIQTLHMARAVGRGRALRNFGEVAAAVPETLLWPATWARLAFGMLPLAAMERLKALKHRRDVAEAAR